MNHLLAPSILSADFGQLKEEIEIINQSMADWFHVDVMDGVFVPNISFGFPIMKVLQKYAHKPLDVHLMIVDPDKYIKTFVEEGAHIITVHYEACTHLHRTIHHIRNHGAKAGVAINPHTPVSLLEDVIRDLDLVLVMSVNPGFGGQQFIERTYDKLGWLREIIAENEAECLVEVDGGVTADNAHRLVQAGADVLVAGNAIFADGQPRAAIEFLKNPV
jgi:ribulose-phosphate 3-epimerase